MAFTTPATSTAGTALTSGYLNTYVRDNVAWMSTDSPACRAYRTTAQSIPTSTFQVISLDSERFDNAAMHSTSSNTSRIVVPSGGDGKYLFGGVFEFANNATGNRQQITLLNSATEIAYSSGPGDASASCPISVCASYALAATDYVEQRAWQNSGGSLNVIVSSSRYPEFWAMWFRT